MNIASALLEWISFVILRVYLRALRVEEFCILCEPVFLLDSEGLMENVG